MFGALDISTSGLVAQRTRLNVIAANIANKDTLLDAEGRYEPYRRRIAMLSAGDPTRGTPDGVQVLEIALDDAPLRLKHEPSSPYADADGYVAYPNVDGVVEQMNAMEAARSYEANITAIEATKSMMSIALEMLG